MITYGSVCSGIEAATLAWRPLGWRAAWFAEIEPFPCAVLAHHYPEVANLGNMATIAPHVLAGDVEAPDILVGGTPCQAFSVAGLRAGLEDPRGQLALAFCQLANAVDAARLARERAPCIIVWENVPGVLSDKGNAFGCFLAGLAGEADPLIPPGGKWSNAGRVLGPARAVCWRVIDAQYFGVAQRRRRVFVVASARAGFDPSQVLFERDGVRRDSPPSRAPREDASGTLAGGARRRGGQSLDDVPIVAVDCRSGTLTGAIAHPIQAGCKGPSPGTIPHLLTFVKTHRATSVDDAEIWRQEAPIAPTLTARERDYNDGQMQVPAFSCKDHGADAGVVSPTLRSMGHDNSHANGGGQVAIAFGINADALDRSGEGDGTAGTRSGLGISVEVQPCLRSRPGAVAIALEVRRLTPRECERLQGLPDDYTRIPWSGAPAEECPDGHRYKAIGNSWAVPCGAWIGQRIAIYLQEEPMCDRTLLPPPHCRILDVDDRVVLADNEGSVYFEISPDGYDANNRPIWSSPASREDAHRRAICLAHVLTAYHNSTWLREAAAAVHSQG